LPYCFEVKKISRNQLRLSYVLQSLQVSDKPQDDDGASPFDMVQATSALISGAGKVYNTQQNKTKNVGNK